MAELFHRRNIYTAWDFVHYLPNKYIDRRSLKTIRSTEVGEKTNLLVTVQSYQSRRLRNRRMILEMTVSDETGVLKLIFFQFKESFMKRKYPEGSRILIFGEMKLYRTGKNMTHPEIQLWEEGDDEQLGIYPLYPLTEGLYQKTVRNIFHSNLQRLVETIDEDPRSVRDGKVDVSLKEAFLGLHNPSTDLSIDDLNEKKSVFHKRIIYDEFFYLQLGVLSKKYRLSKQRPVELNVDLTLMKQALSALPFQLTTAQKTVLNEIVTDVRSGISMNRLVQGDVGSGKTIVAFLASLVVIAAKAQVAFMAPTEILAEQHYKNLKPYEDLLGIRIELLTGSTKTKERKRILYDLEQGLANLVIGTHALLTEDVYFQNLGLAIIDEQHRFGVQQRAALKSKMKQKSGSAVPHILVMTATPIPRTLSMCLYGDLDVSIINELPKGRKPIVTQVFHEKQRSKMYDLILAELNLGRQIYFVYPLIEESEKLDLKNATQMSQNIAKAFPGFHVELLHGRLKSEEKESVMTRFKKKEADILVSTTVIEVGVDVPNASVMVIENAERFGLSQLHQLRGRVGRGAEQSYCFLLASYAKSEESRFRLKVMEETNDGFRIAEEDLNLRGPGEFLGTRQSGIPEFRLAELVRDAGLLKVAKARAEEVLAEDPDLKLEKNQHLKKIMLHRWGKKLDLSLV